MRHRPHANPRGADTRRRILGTAIAMFAANGYDGATTRMLADRAGVTLPAIQYYFGSKEGLYRAAVDLIARQIEQQLAPARVSAQAVLAQKNPSRRALAQELYGMLDAFAVVVIGTAIPQSWSLFVTRAEVENSAALLPLHESIVRQLVLPCAALVGRLLELPPEDQEVRLRTATILGQVLIFHRKCGAKHVSRTLGFLNEFDERHLQAIQVLVRQQTAAILRAARERRT